MTPHSHTAAALPTVADCQPRVSLPERAANSLRHRAAAPQGLSIWHNARSPDGVAGAIEDGVSVRCGSRAVFDLDAAPQTIAASGVRALHEQTGGRT